MLDIFNCALVWVVEDIINSNLAGIRWYSDYLQLFTNNSNNNKIYIVKKKKEEKWGKKEEEILLSESCRQILLSARQTSSNYLEPLKENVLGEYDAVTLTMLYLKTLHDMVSQIS